MWLVALLIGTAGLGGCSRLAKPWREERTIGPHFRVVEWMRGTKARRVPVGADIDKEASAASGPHVGVVGWMDDLEAEDAGKTGVSEVRRAYGGEPHGFSVEVTEASVYLQGEEDAEPIAVYKGDVRFWPSPDGTMLIVQTAWRDAPIEIVDTDGSAKLLPYGSTLGLGPTYNNFPFAFMRWLKDSRRIIVLTVHRPEVRGYVYISKWLLDLETGIRELAEERLLLLSSEVSDWRLVPISMGATASEVLPILNKLAQDDEMWVRDAARRALSLVNRRARYEP